MRGPAAVRDERSRVRVRLLPDLRPIPAPAGAGLRGVRAKDGVTRGRLPPPSVPPDRMEPPMDLGPALDVATRAAREAGELLRVDFHRAGGPRGQVDKAEADVEAEDLIRGRLRDAFPDWSFLGEETGRANGAPGAPIWLVDPNDGTRDYLQGRR